MRPRARSRVGEGEIGFGLLERGHRLVAGGLERPAVDGEQLVAGVHHLPVAEVDRIEIAGDARAHLDRIDGDEAADVLLLVRHRFTLRLSDGDFRRRRGSAFCLRLLFIAAGERRGEQWQCECQE